MPLVKKQITVADGATSDQILAGTTYEYVGPGTRLVVAAAADAAGTQMNFNVNNAEFARDAEVSEKVTGEPFGWKGGYVMNDMVTTAAETRITAVSRTKRLKSASVTRSAAKVEQN